jgi:hypothetical protein
MPAGVQAAWDPAAIEEAIADDPKAAEEAWNRLRQLPGVDLPAFHGLKLAEEITSLKVSEQCLAILAPKGLTNEFVRALQTQGVAIEHADPDWATTHMTSEDLAQFSRRQAVRCRIWRNGAASGSGVLMGPNTVLTAWHVIAVDAPAKPQIPAPVIEVELAGGRRMKARLPARRHSFCGDDEYLNKMPTSDLAVHTRDDFVLLSLDEPAGLHLPFAQLPTPAQDYKYGAGIWLLHFPEGEDQGVVPGKLSRWPGLRARWKHDCKTSGGSSGGGCFNTSFDLIGIHQGKAADGSGRMVPLIRFVDQIEAEVANDRAPDAIWSLDDTAGGDLVVGREAFFQGFSAASRGVPAMLKGLWVKRIDPKKDVSGLPFTYRMLERMVARDPATRLVRISFDAVIEDLPNEVARRVTAAGFPVEGPTEREGVAAAHTEPEAAITDRSRRLANAIDASAKAAGVRLFLFLEHPAVVFGDEPRWALAGFVDQALRLEHLRLVIAGYEALQLPGEPFSVVPPADSQGAPGLLHEFLSGFTRNDVENLVRRAGEALRRPGFSADRIKEWTDEALDGLENVNGTYEWWAGAQVNERLKTRLAALPAEEVTP